MRKQQRVAGRYTLKLKYIIVKSTGLFCCCSKNDLNFSQSVLLQAPIVHKLFKLLEFSGFHYSTACCSKNKSHTGLTSEVVHEAGLSSNDPLGSCLTEDGDVVLWPLTKWCQSTAQLGRCCVDIPIGEPAVLTQNHLQGETGEEEKWMVTFC